MTEAELIECIKELIEQACVGLDTTEVMELMPKVNSAINMHCVDKIIELTTQKA